MLLHQHLDKLEEAIRATAQHMRLPVTYVEKDYWITLAVFFKIVVTTYLIFTLLDITRFLAHLDLTSQAQQGRNF